MNKIKISILLFSIIICTSFAQQVKFKRVYGGSSYDYGYSGVQTFDKGYLIAGATSSFGFGNTDMYLVKTDSMGIPSWHHPFGGINIERALSVKQTSDTGYVIAGYTNSIGSTGYNMYVIKTDKNGDTTWTKTYGGSDWDFASSIAQTNDGGYIICGSTYSFGHGDKDVYLVKTNSVGDTLWTKTYGGANEDEGSSLYQTNDGGYILSGYTYSYGKGSSDLYYIRTNNLGDTLWTKTLGGTGEDKANAIIETSDGGFAIAGYIYNSSISVNQAYVVRTNSSGDTLWTQESGAPNEAYANDIYQTTDDGILWSGKLKLGGYFDFYLYKTDINGNFNFATTFGTNNGDEEAFFTQQTSDKGYIAGGTTNGTGYGLNDVFLVKTDSFGLSPTSIVIDVKNNAITKSNIEIFPNPFSEKAIVQINFENISSADKMHLKIYDITGKIVLSENEMDLSYINDHLAKGEINAVGLNPGIYFLQLNFEDGVYRQKFIIQH
jgi:hypothetical protein